MTVALFCSHRNHRLSSPALGVCRLNRAARSPRCPGGAVRLRKVDLSQIPIAGTGFREIRQYTGRLAADSWVPTASAG